MPPRQKLAVALRYVAIADSYESFRILKTAISKITPEVCQALISSLQEDSEDPTTMVNLCTFQLIHWFSPVTNPYQTPNSRKDPTSSSTVYTERTRQMTDRSFAEVVYTERTFARPICRSTPEHHLSLVLCLHWPTEPTFARSPSENAP
ncbi:hypothetical protein PR048_010824 [Dryococelus australis]|uniref:Uncharacterized protein n=1 Tax=Dryococelus australis TaxID=614101 RepID=A0ABQ9I5Q6_9NEOP|nr:hypothetical protein PR048_010824 [Dryococelus australis]